MVEERTEIQYASWSSILPPAQELARLEQVLPGATERLFSETERQAAHRRCLERTAVIGEVWRAHLGLGAGFVLSMAILWVSYQLSMSGHPFVGGTLGVADIGTLAGVFIYGTNSRKQERIQKTRILTGQADQDNDPPGDTHLPASAN